jgi:hypothetical protein
MSQVEVDEGANHQGCDREAQDIPQCHLDVGSSVKN